MKGLLPFSCLIWNQHLKTKDLNPGIVKNSFISCVYLSTCKFSNVSSILYHMKTTFHTCSNVYEYLANILYKSISHYLH